MAETKTVLEQAYSAFNRRDIDGALALMTDDVSWPKASEGGRVVGKEEIAPTGLDNGASLIPVSNRWRSP
jgi:ketosteroid isomerase-like protein